MVKIFFEHEQKFPLKLKLLYKKIAKETLALLDIEGRTEINVIISDNKYIRALSKLYKQKDKATDVLSFANDWHEVRKFIDYNMLGDIVISYEKVISQAKEYQHSQKREWAYLFTHGLLHLCGLDHQTEKHEKYMNALASKIMKKVKVSRDA